MGIAIVILLLFCFALPYATSWHQPTDGIDENSKSPPRSLPDGKREIIDVKGGPDDVVWAVQLSDLHFSVHHPDRALDFRELVGPSLFMINPSLVFITGDLTDGKSKDLLTMKQDEEEWVEYRDVMEDVIKRSGLKKSLFYDLRGNHDSFGVPVKNGTYDFFSKYSISGQLRRIGPVNSVTLQTGERKLLFVGFDSTMSVGLRGPTNLFGHLTDQLLTEIDSELSQWNYQSAKPVNKISFGHFPLSFSATSFSGKSLKDIFFKNFLSVYLCGHLHTKFGKNLKRHHQLGHHLLFSQKIFQLNAHQMPYEKAKNCSNAAPPVPEFWEWEMGDWRMSRAMRILAIDKGYVSFVDIDFRLGARRTIVLPTFPLDSRFMLTTLSLNEYDCQSIDSSSYWKVRALVFSTSPIVSVVARIYDTKPRKLYMVMETSMRKDGSTSLRGDLYTAPWNFKAFEDPSPERFWLQIEAIDIMGRSTLTEARPFSINGRSAKLSWTWKEFLTMGCQWADLYYPILWSFYLLMFSILLIPRAGITFSKKQYTYKNFIGNKGFVNGIGWVSTELYGIPLVWYGILVYLLYLVSCPWLFGEVFTHGGERGYMTYKGWVVKSDERKVEFIGFPDIMVVVLPHLFFVVLPAILVIGLLAAERGMHREHCLRLSGKKEDDHGIEDKGFQTYGVHINIRSKFYLGGRWIRNILLMVSLVICWKHFKNCRALVKAYEMNPFIHFPVYCLSVLLLLAYAVYKTRRV